MCFLCQLSFWTLTTYTSYIYTTQAWMLIYAPFLCIVQHYRRGLMFSFSLQCHIPEPSLTYGRLKKRSLYLFYWLTGNSFYCFTLIIYKMLKVRLQCPAVNSPPAGNLACLNAESSRLLTRTACCDWFMHHNSFFTRIILKTYVTFFSNSKTDIISLLVFFVCFKIYLTLRQWQMIDDYDVFSHVCLCVSQMSLDGF